MTVHYRAQFQTTDGRTHAVVDTQPITLERLRVAEILLTTGSSPLVDFTAVRPDLIAAAERLARSA